MYFIISVMNSSVTHELFFRNILVSKMKVKVTQSCPILPPHGLYSLPLSSAYGIL